MVFDILKGEDGDLGYDEETGDLLIGISDNQHFDDIIMASQGDFKEFPLLGVGFFKFMNSRTRKQDLESAIRFNLNADNVSNIDVVITDTGVKDELDIEVYGEYL